MKKYIIILLAICCYMGASAQGIYNNGARIVNDGNGSYWVVDNGDFTFTSTSATNPAQMDCLKVMDDASLTIGSSSTPSFLTVNQNLTVNTGGSLLIKSGSGGTGSLIVGGTATGNVTVERFLTHDKWHYMACQTNISGKFSTLNMGLTGGVGKDQFYRWEESSGTWFDILNGNGSGSLMETESFVSGKGYAINYITEDKTLSLTGTPYTSNQSITLTKTNSSSHEGSNLVGNLFCSDIAINTDADGSNNFLTQNSAALDDSYTAIYVWDESVNWNGESNADYDTYTNASGAFFASPGQAFMVVAKTNNASLAFNTNIRKHGSSTFYKSTNQTQSKLKLIASSEKYYNHTEIAFIAGMSEGLDPSYDAAKMKGNPNIALYTRLVEDNGTDFAIQALPDTDIENYVIPVGIDVSENTLCTFNLTTEEMDGFSIFLQDTKENSETNLMEQTYSTTVTESGTGRFYLHFKAVNGVAENSNNMLQIWASNSIITIANMDNLKGDISVVNMFGQTVYYSTLTGDANQQITINATTGYYIVSIVTAEGIVNRKVNL